MLTFYQLLGFHSHMIYYSYNFQNMWCIFFSVFSLCILAFFACPEILSLLSSVLSYLHSSSWLMWPVWAKLLPCLSWNFPLLQKIPPALCYLCSARRISDSLGSVGTHGLYAREQQAWARMWQGFPGFCWIPGLLEKSTEDGDMLHITQEELRSF